jgi:hypothetical protein
LLQILWMTSSFIKPLHLLHLWMLWEEVEVLSLEDLGFRFSQCHDWVFFCFAFCALCACGSHWTKNNCTCFWRGS